jgi:hypothetical protein
VDDYAGHLGKIEALNITAARRKKELGLEAPVENSFVTESENMKSMSAILYSVLAGFLGMTAAIVGVASTKRPDYYFAVVFVLAVSGCLLITFT